MKYKILTLGCKVNSYESQYYEEQFEKNGFIKANAKEISDIYIINTCTVTNTAASKSRQKIHLARKENPNAIVVAIGCYIQFIDKKKRQELNVDLVIGAKDKSKLVDIVMDYIQNHNPHSVLDIEEFNEFESMPIKEFESKKRAFLKIQDGCNQFCSYCIIPYARGRERSMEPDLVIAEAKRLSKKYKEIVLTGIHTGRYGKEYNITLTDIIRRILIETENVRIRISSIEITEVSDDLIQLMKENDRMTKFLHIPLQSGCDSVLKRMHRPYDTEEYYAKIEKIRKEIPGVSISTDLITGFPQESEQEFLETYEFLKKCHFSFLHVFPYSLREGTAAAKMNGQIDPQVKKLRTKKCIALSEKLYDAYQLSKVNERAEIIAEWVKDGYTTGHTSEYIPVKIEEELVHGEKYTVVLERYEDHQMYARKVSD